MMPTGSNGYTCSICGSWVMYNTTHMCGGMPQFNQPGSLTIPPCRAPFNPLTAEMVRLIIREELERHFASKPEGQQK